VLTEGIRLASDGEAADGNTLLKETDSAKGKYKDYDVHGEASQTNMDDKEEGEDETEAMKRRRKRTGM
jgi:proliferating cell nuclear antigen